MHIPISRPYIAGEELRAVQQPLEAGWIAQGAQVETFERRVADFVGCPFAVAASSGTAALHLAVTAMGAGPGDEVIVPAFTWVSTANAVEYAGATPVFCDIDLATLNIDVDRMAEAITPRTVGIIPVHLFGLCAEMTPILSVARRRGLWVIEDAACAFGAWYREQHAGTMGDVGIFSFHPRKPITTGEGGMLISRHPEVDRAARRLRDHGAVRADPGAPPALGRSEPDCDRLGYNYRLTDLQGALGCAQLDRARWMLERRAHRARRYDEALAGLPWLTCPSAPAHHRHAYQAYVCLYGSDQATPASVERRHAGRNGVIAGLHARGVASQPGTHAPVLLSYYARKYRLRPEAFPKAYAADRLTLALPLYVQMTDAEQARVVDALAACGGG